jgi:hypothetical protein
MTSIWWPLASNQRADPQCVVDIEVDVAQRGSKSIGGGILLVPLSSLPPISSADLQLDLGRRGTRGPLTRAPRPFGRRPPKYMLLQHLA